MINYISKPFKWFFKLEAASGLVLLFAAIIALVVSNVPKAARWYEANRDCKVKYQDDTWAILEFDNVDLALVSAAEHPPHIAFVDNSIKNGTKHRDGSESIYDHDGFGNIIEKIKYSKKSKKKT